MMNRTLIVILAGLLSAASPAGAQRDAGARIDAARERVAAAGIPVALLDARIAEGRAKGVPMDRIAVAVERRATALAQAQEAMQGAARDLRPSDLSAGADAVEAGIGGAALRTVIERARVEDRSVAIAVLTHLHREHGVPVGQALSRVTEALGRGPEALRNLPAQAAAARGRRGPPEGVGNRPGNAGRGPQGQGGPPQALPVPGQGPGQARPEGAGPPPGKGRPPGRGRPGGA